MNYLHASSAVALAGVAVAYGVTDGVISGLTVASGFGGACLLGYNIEIRAEP